MFLGGGGYRKLAGGGSVMFFIYSFIVLGNRVSSVSVNFGWREMLPDLVLSISFMVYFGDFFSASLLTEA
jgi:hypothetical protein